MVQERRGRAVEPEINESQQPEMASEYEQVDSIPDVMPPVGAPPTKYKPLAAGESWGNVAPGITPRVGDRVWYKLGNRSDKPAFGRWLRAYVINVDSKGARYEPPAGEGALHLEVITDRRIDGTAQVLIIRQEVMEGTDLNNWQRTIDEPAAKAEFEHGMAQRRMRDEVGRELAQANRKAL